jgi:hypothetical protein
LSSETAPPDAAFTLAAFLERSAREVFAHYGLRLDVAGDEELRPRLSDDDVLAILRFAGDGGRGPLRGTLVLATDVDTVARVLPDTLSGSEGDTPSAAGRPTPPSPSLEESLDWIGELGNQVLGRVKERLLGRGLDVAVESLETVVARDADVGTLDPDRTVGHALTSPDGHLLAWFEVAADAPLSLGAPDSPALPSSRRLY